MSFALLWTKILDSSVWIKENKETRLVWITLLAMKNAEGKVMCSLIGLADRAKVTVDECKAALKIFKEPDPDDSSKVEDGRRVREIPGGWQIINHDLYRFSTEAKRELWRLNKAEQRAKKKQQGTGAVVKPGNGVAEHGAFDHQPGPARKCELCGFPVLIPNEECTGSHPKFIDSQASGPSDLTDKEPS